MDVKEEKNKEEKNKKKPIIIATVLSAVIITALLMWWQGSQYESTDNAQLDANIIPIRSSVSGYVKTIYFKDNAHVKKGEILLTIDDTDLKTRVAQSQAALENAKANLLSVTNTAHSATENAGASVLSSSAIEENIHSAKAKLQKAEEDLKRMTNMLKEKAATQSQFDIANTELEVAKAQYNSSVNQYKASQSQSHGVQSQAEAQQAQITLAQALVKQREAELILAQTQLKYASIESPCDGIVSRRAVEEGQYISIGQPLCSTIENSNLWITANFKETQIAKIKIGQDVKIKLDAFPGIHMSGKVESFIGATGAKFSLLPPDNSTGNFVKITQRVPVRISITHLSSEDANMLFPGLSAFVEISIK